MHVAAGRGKDSLKGFVKRIRKSKAKIECIATDLSPAYTAAVREAFPKAIFVYDHFHVVKMFNETINGTRRRIYREIREKTAREVLTRSLGC